MPKTAISMTRSQGRESVLSVTSKLIAAPSPITRRASPNAVDPCAKASERSNAVAATTSMAPVTMLSSILSRICLACSSAP